MQTRNIGIIFVIIGIVMMAYTGISYVTSENVIDLGAIEINKKKEQSTQWSPLIGILLLTGGIIVIAINKKRT